MFSFETIEWRGTEYRIPPMSVVEEWACGDVCETPDGREVEHDHPDGWLALLRVV